jgi:dCMP deaminase
MPAGWDNDCEYKDYNSLHDSNYFELKTRPEVLHAEENALIKLARDGESGKDASLFVTHAPCIQCAKLIYGAGIKDVYYKHTYRDTAGLDFLFKCGISITKIGEK